MERLPRKLAQPPLVEASFEIRFAAATSGLGEILPGLLFGKFSDRYPQVQPLPIRAIPKAVRDQDENLRYQPEHQLVGTAGRILVGDRNVALSKSPPYEGWSTFRDQVMNLAKVLQETNLVTTVERLSLRCINVVPCRAGSQLAQLKLRVDTPFRNMTEAGFNARFELREDPHTIIVNVVPGATAHFPAGERAGVLVDVDGLLRTIPTNVWDQLPQEIDRLHDLVKSTFFGLLNVILQNHGPSHFHNHDPRPEAVIDSFTTSSS